jgi:hypothetical protein
MSEIQVVFSPSERDLLVRMLNEALGEKRVEVRRTHFSMDFRNQLQAEEALIRELFGKLSQTAETA